MAGCELFINLDFDLSLRPDGGGARREVYAQRARELAPVFLHSAGSGDSVLLWDAIDEVYLEYLWRLGLGQAAPRLLPDLDATRAFVPYGWNAEATRLAERYEAATAHPPLDVIERVNSKRFSAEAERNLFGESPVLGVFEDLDALESTLSSAASADDGFVAKAVHGNAGIGNRRLRGRTIDDDLRRGLEAQLAGSGALVLERWQARRRDFAVSMKVGGTGLADEPRIGEVVNTADGSFLGALLPRRGEHVPWAEALRRAAAAIARRLAGAGYIGPACFDAYTHVERGVERLRPLADLNARLGMSEPFAGIARRIGDDRAVYGRLFATRKLRLPAELGAAVERLGASRYDLGTRRGALLASPPRLGVGDAGRVPRRIAVCFCGDGREDVLAMDRAFRGEHER